MNASGEETLAIQPRFLQPLRIISASLPAGSLDWAITGSLGFALQGVSVEVHDIDLQTDLAGAYEIERRLGCYSTLKVALRTSERLQSHFGALEIEAVKVEIMGALQKRREDGSWEDPVQIAPIRRWITYQGLKFPVLSLEHEYRAYLYLGRTEKVHLLQRFLQQRS